MLNLDTHILVHALQGALTAPERALLKSRSWSISAIVLWELAKLRQLGRIGIDIHSASFEVVLTRLRIWPLDLAVCRGLGELDFHSDPADELIAATSIVHNVPLLTRDRKLLRSRATPLALRP